jgi:predicted SAM-dependent methyltransferase
MSCDADRASIRYTKDLILDAHIQKIQEVLTLESLNNILDIGSNRGAFIRKFITINSKASITAVEPESSVMDRYNSETRILKHLTRFESIDFKKNTYDFIYMAHSLEHLISASASLRKIHNLLIQGGYVFIAVPNMDSILLPYFEEQFIDTHNFHFTERTLVYKLREIGFSIINMTSFQSDEICILAKKDGSNEFTGEKIETTDLIEAFHYYPVRLSMYRNQLRQVGQRINVTFESTQVIYWGAGRIFDGLIKIGGINTKNIECLVDKTLGLYMDQVNGLQIVSPKDLGNVSRLTPVIVCSREYAAQISLDAATLGFRDIRNFMDFAQTEI